MPTAKAIGQLRFDHERHLFDDLNRYPEIQAWQRELNQQTYFNLRQRYLLGSAVKVTAELFPHLTTIYQDCLGHVSEYVEGHLYIHQNSEYNANVYAYEHRFDILLTSALVKDFKPTEIAFVIGHEIGHVLFEHNKIPAVRVLFEENQSTLPKTLVKRLFQWSYAAEISADRIGFLACGDLSSAANAFFKTASGIQLNDDNRVVQTLRTQYAEIEKLTAQLDNPGISTHPLIPIRFKSLELISLDLLNFRNNRHAIRPQDLQIINQQVQAVLAQTTPVHLEGRNDTPSQTENEFISLLLLCLLYVAGSDGAVKPTEIQFLRTVIERATCSFRLDDVLISAQNDSFQAELLKEISSFRVSTAQMLEILQHCAALCQQPNPLEMMAMKTLCMTLKQKGSLVEVAFAK